jgi:hypothetical protein
METLREAKLRQIMEKRRARNLAKQLARAFGGDDEKGAETSGSESSNHGVASSAGVNACSSSSSSSSSSNAEENDSGNPRANGSDNGVSEHCDESEVGDTLLVDRLQAERAEKLRHIIENRKARHMGKQLARAFGRGGGEGPEKSSGESSSSSDGRGVITASSSIADSRNDKMGGACTTSSINSAEEAGSGSTSAWESKGNAKDGDSEGQEIQDDQDDQEKQEAGEEQQEQEEQQQQQQEEQEQEQQEQEEDEEEATPTDDTQKGVRKQLQDKFLLKLWWKALKTRDSQTKDAQKASAAKASAAKASATQEDDGPEKSTREHSLQENSLWDVDALTFDVGSPTFGGELPGILVAMREAGCCCLKNAVGREKIDECKQAATGHFQKLHKKVVEISGEEGTIKTREIISRNKGRYDMVDGVDAAPFATLQWGPNAPWVPLMKKLLGVSCYLLHTGIIMSLPGAELQGIHPDGT